MACDMYDHSSMLRRATLDLMFCSCCLKILHNFEQEAPHFNFAQGPANYVAGAAYVSCPRSPNGQWQSWHSTPDCLALSLHDSIYIPWFPISHILKARSLLHLLFLWACL